MPPLHPTGWQPDAATAFYIGVGTLAFLLLAALIATGCYCYNRRKSTNKVSPALQKQLKLAEESRVRGEARIDAAAARLEALFAKVETNTLNTGGGRRALSADALRPSGRAVLNPVTLPPMALAFNTRAADGGMNFNDDELKPTENKLMGPSVLPAISREKADADMISRNGVSKNTYGVWRSGPVPPNWRPPGDEVRFQDKRRDDS